MTTMGCISGKIGHQGKFQRWPASAMALSKSSISDKMYVLVLVLVCRYNVETR
jgi:hypothetical protein